jgi:hypothetical protein
MLLLPGALPTLLISCALRRQGLSRPSTSNFIIDLDEKPQGSHRMEVQRFVNH